MHGEDFFLFLSGAKGVEVFDVMDQDRDKFYPAREYLLEVAWTWR